MIAYKRKRHGRWTFKDERRLIALASSRTLLEIAAKLNRSVDSVSKKAADLELSLPSLDRPRARMGLKAKGSEIAWIDVDQVSQPGEYDFRDGIIRIKWKDLEIWKKDRDAKLTLIRFIPTTGPVQMYGLSPDNFALR